MRCCAAMVYVVQQWPEVVQQWSSSFIHPETSPCAAISSDVQGWSHLMWHWSKLCGDGLKQCGTGYLSQFYTLLFLNVFLHSLSFITLGKRDVVAGENEDEPVETYLGVSCRKAEKVGGSTSPKMIHQCLWTRSPLWIIRGI